MKHSVVAGPQKPERWNWRVETTMRSLDIAVYFIGDFEMLKHSVIFARR